MTDFPGMHHVAVTVTNLEASRKWYRQLLDAEPILDEDVPALPGHHQGFHHIGFGCADKTELEQWQARLDKLGITHGGIAEDALGYGLSFRDPDDVALEFWAPRA
jgi:catechol 2,3-dioxygenase-like lactoylglutathione lyase family enzyme